MLEVGQDHGRRTGNGGERKERTEKLRELKGNREPLVQDDATTALCSALSGENDVIFNRC